MSSPPVVDLGAAEAAIAALLRAVGAPVATDPELRETPNRAARALIEELLDGYRVDPADVLRDGVAANERGLVVLTGVRFVSMCPHHLLPSYGVAHVGYLPGGRVVGLGTLVRLVEAYAHRLILQESLGQRVADALVAHLAARGAGVVIEGRHTCLSARGERQPDAVVVTTALAGVLAADAGERAVFLRAIPRAGGDGGGSG
jgi:GTP cyclohydrolase I